MKGIKKITKNISCKIKELIKFFTSKNLTAYSGALSYFLFSGLISFVALLIKTACFFELETSVLKDFLLRLFPVTKAVESIFFLAEKRSNVIFLTLVGIYTATNFYFHLIGIGEKIFLKRNKRGFFKRLFSLIYLAIILLSVAVALLLEIVGKKIIQYIGISGFFASLIYFVTTLIINFLLSFAMHVFATPIRKKTKMLFKGIFFTFIIWELTGFCFSVYTTNFLSSMSDILSFFSTFMLYLYFLMLGLTGGIALNAKYAFKNFKDF